MHPKFNLLVVENEELSLQPLSLLATRMGHHVVKSEGSELPIVMMNAWQEYIQAVVLDWTISCVVYGPPLIEALHRIAPEVPFFIATGYGENIIRPLLPKGPSYQFLIKPYLAFEFDNGLRLARPRPLLRKTAASA